MFAQPQAGELLRRAAVVELGIIQPALEVGIFIR
jgi:hypothetical protein